MWRIAQEFRAMPVPQSQGHIGIQHFVDINMDIKHFGNLMSLEKGLKRKKIEIWRASLLCMDSGSCQAPYIYLFGF